MCDLEGSGEIVSDLECQVACIHRLATNRRGGNTTTLQPQAKQCVVATRRDFAASNGDLVYNA